MNTWKPYQEAIMREFYPSHSTTLVASVLGKTRKQVYQKARKMGLVKTEIYISKLNIPDL